MWSDLIDGKKIDWKSFFDKFKNSYQIVFKGLDEIITTVSSQRYQNIITQNIITKFNITWNSITKL